MKMELKKIKPYLLFLSGGIFLVVLLQAALSFVLPADLQQKLNFSKKLTASVVSAYDGITLEARAAYVFDIPSSKVLYAFNENEKLPLASVTKLMTAFVARERAPESALLVLTPDDLAAEGDSGLRVGERWRLGDLLNAMLIISSNDAAHGVARFVGAEEQPVADNLQADARAHFIQMMNSTAQELGLKQMEFFNESGLDIDGTTPTKGLPATATATATAGGYGSAHDVAVLFSALWKKYPETVDITALPAARIVSEDNIAHVLPNTDEAIGKFSGLVASKTGYTTLAGGNLAIIFDRGINDPVVAVVLGSTQKGRFDDMAKLVVATGKVEIPAAK